MRRIIRRFVTLSLLLAGLPLGCTSLAQRPSGYSSAAPATTPMAGGAALDRAPRAEASVYDVTPAERPGLGTVFGEARYSAVQEVDFERQGDSPMFLASLHYNDAEGVEALRARLGSRYASSEPMFRYYLRDKPYLWGGVTISVVDDAGNPLAAYHEADHVLLVGETGQRYALRIDNRTGQRFELVASIDGLDVTDGKLASPGKRGYVVGPHSQMVIEGYRRNLMEVAAFRFGSVRDSYASQTGEQGDRNVGVIGVALFAERGVTAVPGLDLDNEAGRRQAADPFPGRFAAPPPRPYY
jgi:hypothetical protein